MSVRPLISPRVADAVAEARIHLAAAHRLAVLHELEEGIDNHFTMTVPGRDDQYLILPYGRHWSEARASDMIVFDEQGRVLEGREGSLELSAPIAAIYDRWCASVTEDLPFYLEACANARGAVVEVGAGTGRITIPLAREGHNVVAVDNSAAMLERLAASATTAGVGDRITIVQADLNELPRLEDTDRVIAPFRVLLHLTDDAQRAAFLARVRTQLVPGGRFAFDVFEPTRADINATHNRVLTRETGVTERARWDARLRHLDLDVSFRAHRTTMRLCWTSGWRWRALLIEAGFAIVEAYHGFDGQPYNGQRGDSAWIAERIE